MRALQYTSKARKNISNLLYSTCANDLFIKQSNNIEFFVIAFFIEFHHLFIADSLLMNALQKHCIDKTKLFLSSKMDVYNVIVAENKNTFLEVFDTNNMFSVFHKLRLFEKSNSEDYSVSKFF